MQKVQSIIIFDTKQIRPIRALINNLPTKTLIAPRKFPRQGNQIKLAQLTNLLPLLPILLKVCSPQQQLKLQVQGEN